MSESSQRQIGDGPDEYGRAIGQMARAAKRAGAAAAVPALAAPWGAALSAAWSLRHTLFKILVCACLSLLFLVVMLVSLPSVVSARLFGLDGLPPDSGMMLETAYADMSDMVSSTVEEGYSRALARVEQLIAEGGYDRELSMEALVNYAQGSAGYDVCYILAAYSASMEQQNAGKEDMKAKLERVAANMFPVTWEVKERETEIPADSDGEENASMAGERAESATETVKYLECTIHPFDDTVIYDAFGLDLNAMYGSFEITYGQAIDNMANALKRTLQGSVAPQSPQLLDTELTAFVNAQSCSASRKALLMTGLSLVGRVTYFWGGKSAAGWNDEWNIPRRVTAEGSPTTGTVQPYGLDCSGFTAWVYSTALGADIGAGTLGQFANTVSVSDAELLPGDLGFLADPAGGYSHVLFFAGYAEDGQRRWLHSTGGEGVVLNTPGYEDTLVLRRLSQVDFTASVEMERSGAPALVLEVEVTHYCACSICCGSNADGITASGKRVEPGMVAMSSYYPFGTQIVINGRVYTVEDRGGSGIENDIHRVDIYVPDHNQALRMGRYRTTAAIYRKIP